MIKFIQCILLVGAVISFGWSAEKKPGGQGKIEVFSWSLGNNCFKPDSGTVYEVCADYTINWKMWSLMGEPVGDYNLAWKLTTITLMDPKRKIKSTYASSQMPNELKNGVRAIELYIDGTADVNILKSTVSSQHHFNTGIAVKSGKGSSINIPESPSWDKLFEHSRPGCDSIGIGGGATYIDAKTAKEIFSGGITLSGLSLCSKSGVSELSTLQSAIGKLCEKPGADKKYQFCPKQEEKPKKEKILKKNDTQPSLAESILDGPTTNQPPLNASELLDEQAERPIVQKKLAQEITTYRYMATPGCQKTLADIDTCYKNTGCKKPDTYPDVETCKKIPSRPRGSAAFGLVLQYAKKPGDVCYEVDSECREYRKEMKEKEAEEARVRSERLEREQASWDSNYASLKKQCEMEEQKRAAFEVCQKQFKNICNPNYFNTVDECLDKQVKTKGPTYHDAKKLMQKEWNQRAKTGGTLMNSILD